LCPVCGQGFRRARLSQEFCSQRCRQRSHRAGITAALSARATP
jgi:predicted nucleic acid-binding Zn ribbon protein